MLNVIIVDDELLMRIGLKSMIDWEEHGFQLVAEAANGKEVLEISTVYQPDLIITDIKMPVMDGLVLIKEAKAKFPACQYIILSCMDEFQYAKEAIRLGAIDYLIKSELKQQQLIDLLERVKHNFNGQSRSQDNVMPANQYRDSIYFLKQTFLKDVFSGFLNEHEIEQRIKLLHLNIEKNHLILIKLRINQFGQIKQKYVEQDEKLLRYTIINIVEEIIPRKWKKEIIVDSSSEYLLIMNLEPEQSPTEQLSKLFVKIEEAMNDFLNVTLSIGVSRTASNLIELRRAYQEADDSLNQHFYESNSKVLYADMLHPRSLEKAQDHLLTREQETEFRLLVEQDGVKEKANPFLLKLKMRIYNERIKEEDARKLYIRIVALISSCFPVVPELIKVGMSPCGTSAYELIMKAGKLDELHDIVVSFLEYCLQHNEENQLSGILSYVEKAQSIIKEQYADQISLQSVASEINVNPSYLSRIFKQETGENFISYLTRVRLEKAKKLLRNKNLKIYAVAHQTGYSNTTYFSKIFKKVTGCSPEDYRNHL